MKTKNIKQEKGITLIALVITIIVLLILAGVAISMLTGDNGILTQAGKAKTDTETKSNQEKVQLAVLAALTDGLGTVDIKDTEGTSKGSLKNALEKEGITGYKGDGVISYKGETYIVTEDGEVTKETKKFTADKYGELTDYKIDIDGDGVYNDWQVFYDDGTNVYLIAKSLVTLDEDTKSKTGLSLTWQKNYEWYNEPAGSETYANGKCVKTLTTKSNWVSFVDNSTAEYAVGGPTIEMFAKSYNEKYPNGTNGIIDYTTDTYGYKVGWKNSEGVTYSAKLTGLIDDDMYTSVRYWLATPSNNSGADIMVIDNNNCEIQADCHTTDIVGTGGTGIRPIICLKSTAQFEKVGDVWNIK